MGSQDRKGCSYGIPWQPLHHWRISRYYKAIENCKTVSSIVDRLYVYDNSVDGEDAKIQFRLVNGVMGKMYVTDVPEWAQAILPDTENEVLI